MMVYDQNKSNIKDTETVCIVEGFVIHPFLHYHRDINGKWSYTRIQSN